MCFLMDICYTYEYGHTEEIFCVWYNVFFSLKAVSDNYTVVSPTT